jgi:hypothetical protein
VILRTGRAGATLYVRNDCGPRLVREERET